ncbi:MAG: hypothetical protein JO269_04170 [Burkholderiaceae bacterium]|nr:hypothetical protein [Burkholderiaceae bacterium]
MKIQLVKIAHARSGDKGDKTDLSLFAYDAQTYEILKREVGTERVAAHFKGIAAGAVQRYELDNLWALKFVLHQALDGGAARSLRSDNLGKSLAAGLLRMEIEVPEDLPIRHVQIV